MDKEFDSSAYMLQEGLTLREYQLKNLELFKYFDKFCRKHNLLYYACGGCVIGAVRHRGFIPWDCDIDVFMPRVDYEKLGKMWNKYADTDHYAYDRTTKNYNMHAQCSGIKDNYTTYIREENKNVDMNHGIMLDIIPLDSLSNNRVNRFFQRLNGLTFSLFNAQRLPNQQGWIFRKLAGVIYWIFKSNDVRYKIWSKAEKRFSRFRPENCNYWCELTTGIHTINLAFPKEWFAKPSEIEFEDMVMFAPTEIKRYLDMRYPGYMQYPSKDQQKPKMNPAFIDLNTPYINYKGIKYCVKNNN